MDTKMKYQMLLAGVLIVIGGILVFGIGKPYDTTKDLSDETLLYNNQEIVTENTGEDTVQYINNNEEKTHMITLQTTMGNITIELFDEQTPKTAENFKKLASEGFYNGTRFHRVIEGFMIQGGDPLSKEENMRPRWGTGGPGYQFADEIKPENANVAGTISMANAGPNTNGSQFFINLGDNRYLDPKHTVFGRVVEGLDVVQAIGQTETGPSDQPIEDVVITAVSVN
jgi:peptidylprolyl isomerase